MKIDNAPLREAALASGMSVNGIARQAGLDPEQLRRSLGLKQHRRKDRHGSGRVYVHRYTRMSQETAMKLLDPLGLDPHEVGL